MPSTTLFLRDFTVLDYALLSAEGGLQGESLYVSVELTGTLDHQGFIFDFGPAKKALKKLVDDTFDHKLVVPSRSPGLTKTAAGWALKSGEENFVYSAPEEAWTVLGGALVTAEAIAAELASRARAVLPANVEGVRFELREESRFARDANFRYTHGLRYHDGNCQRLFHGHRNPVEVYVDGARNEEWELLLATEWEGAHFTAAATLTNRAELDLPLGVRVFNHPGTAEIAYTSPQGIFRSAMPAARLVLLEREPSIENISRAGFDLLRRKGVTGALVVRAYEGLNKGASYSG